MRVLRIAVEKKRWDLMAHIIVLASVSLLSNGDGPQAGNRVPAGSRPGNPGLKRLIKTGGKRA